jgi:hypothetical protein
MRLASRLATIPDCPRSEEALIALADDLRENCADDQEAAWLVREARKWPKWLGTAGLLELLDSKRHPESSRPENQPFDMGPKPPVHCAVCSDWGYVQDAPGHFKTCHCAAGAAVNPGLVDMFNRGVTKPVAALQVVPPRKPITQADIDRAVTERKRKPIDEVS